MLTKRHTQGGFALPTIIIASVILLTVLVTAVTAVGSITSSLATQYYNQLAREAAESGLANAQACLRANSYTPTWTDVAPLKPDTDCNGTVIGSLSKWVINANNIRTSFTVGAPTVGAASSVRVLSTGKTELVRTSDQNQVWRTYTQVAAENSRYNDAPQIAGGAGWKDSGHNGYMLASSGTLYGWGDNTNLQLGDASLGGTVSTPVKLVLPAGVTFVKKVYNSGQGAAFLCILATHQTLGDQAYCRGYGMQMTSGTWERFGLAPGLTALEMALNGFGLDGACVKASDLQAYCAGINDAGGLGLANSSTAFVPIGSPVKFRLDLANPGPVAGSASSLTVLRVFTQDRTSCVIASDNQAYCAGINNYGQLGHANTTTNIAGIGKSTPGRALVPGAPAINDILLTHHGAEEGIFFVGADTRIYMSGHNGHGTADDGAFTGPLCGGVNCYSTPKPITVTGYTKLISIGEEGNNLHSICVLAPYTPPLDSGLWCVGRNTFGQLGAGDCVARAGYYGSAWLTGEKVDPGAMNDEARYQMNAVAVITTLGNVFTAGDNRYGKLGTGAPLQACNGTYAKVLLPVGVSAKAVANADEYTMFILGDNGKVYAMGRNNNGQLGDGTTTDRSTPVEVKVPRQETVY